MNKLKYLFLASIATLSLTGCGTNSTKDNTLPSGGTTIDVTTEEGSIEVKQKLSRNIQETMKGLSSIKVTNTLNNTNATCKVSTKNLSNTPVEGLSLKEIDATLKVKNLKGKAEFGVSGLDKTYGDLKGLAQVNFSGGASLEGNLPDFKNVAIEGTTATVNNKKYSYSINAKDVALAAYYKDSTLYADFSNQGFYSLLSDIQTTANQFLSDFPIAEGKVDVLDRFNEVVGSTRKISSDCSALVSDKAAEKILPELDEEKIASLEKSITGILDDLVTWNEKYNISFVTFKKYDDGKFGFSLSLNKDELVKLIDATNEDSTNESSSSETETDEIDILELLKKFDFSAAILFDENGLLIKTGTSFSASLKGSVPLSISEAISTNVDLAFEVSTGTTSEISYNQPIELPTDFSEYKAVELDL